MPDANPAWIAVQVADLLRRAEECVLEGITLLGPRVVDGGIAEDVDVTLDVEEMSRLKEVVADAADLAEQLALVADRLPVGQVEVRFEEVREGAAADLGEGPIDLHRALLAARVLDVRLGWGALAEALASTDAYLAWEQTTVEQLLGRFRGAEQAVVRRVIGEAGLSPEDVFAECSAESVARLAVVLEGYSGSAPR